MTKEKVGESFGLIADPSSKLNQEASVRAVRATGEVFDLLLTITKVTHNIITASLRDATAPDAIQPPHTVSSASASYQDSLSEVANLLLDEAEMKGLSTPEIREPVLRLFDMPETSLLQP